MTQQPQRKKCSECQYFDINAPDYVNSGESKGYGTCKIDGDHPHITYSWCTKNTDSMTPQPQQEYIITEELRARIIGALSEKGCANLAVRLMEESRPNTSSPSAPTPDVSYEEQLSREWTRGYIAGEGDVKESMINAIAKATPAIRNEVLDEVLEYIDRGEYDECGSSSCALAEVRGKVESLRSTKERDPK